MLILLALLPLASCWGFLGHHTVAYLAQLHFSPEAHLWVNDLLDGEDISDAANWADRVKYQPEWEHTQAWHYIDARDNPPDNCNVDFRRDCLDGCIVSALGEHTAILTNASESHQSKAESLRFVLHFFGDIHQPLHAEILGRGGNEVNVTFDGALTNLHFVWDILIPQKLVELRGVSNPFPAAKVWAAELYNNHDLRECDGDIMACAMEWAIEANQHVCNYILKGGLDEIESKDLGEEYFEGAIDIVDIQVQRAGRRLATWINLMAPSALQVQ